MSSLPKPPEPKKKKKVHRKSIELSMGSKESPVQLTLNSLDQSIQISLNPKHTIKVQSNNQEIWIPPPGKSTAKRISRDCCSQKNAKDDANITLNLPKEGRLILQNGAPIVIESGDPGTSGAFISMEKRKDGPIFQSQGSDDSDDLYASLIKENFEKQCSVLKKSEQLLKEQETKKNILAKYVESLKRSMKEIHLSFIENEKVEGDGRDGSEGQSKLQDLLPSRSEGRSGCDSSTPIQEKAGKSQKLPYQDFIHPNKVCLPADDFDKNQTENGKHEKGKDQATAINHQKRGIVRQNAVAESAMMDLADSMRKSKRLLDKAMETEQSCASLQRQYIQGVENLYEDQQHLLHALYHCADDGSSCEFLDGQPASCNGGGSLEAGTEQKPDDEIEDGREEDVAAEDTEQNRFKINSEPILSHHRHIKSISEQLALANFQLEKLKKELELAKKFKVSKVSDKNFGNGGGSVNYLVEDDSQDLIGSIVHNYNITESKKQKENISQTTITQKLTSPLTKARVSDDEPQAPLSHAEKAMMNQLKKTLDKLLPIVLTDPSEIYAQHLEHEIQDQNEGAIHDDHDQADEDQSQPERTEAHAKRPQPTRRDHEATGARPKYRRGKTADRSRELETPSPGGEEARVSKNSRPEKRPAAVPADHQRKKTQEKRMNQEVPKSVTPDRETRPKTLYKDKSISLTHKGSSGFEVQGDLDTNKSQRQSLKSKYQGEPSRQQRRDREYLEGDDDSTLSSLEQFDISHRSQHHEGSSGPDEEKSADINEGSRSARTSDRDTTQDLAEKSTRTSQRRASGSLRHNEDDTPPSLEQFSISHPSQHFERSSESDDSAEQSSKTHPRVSGSLGADEDDTQQSMEQFSISHPSQYYETSDLEEGEFQPLTPLSYDVSSPEMEWNEGSSRDKTTPPSRHSRNGRHGSGSDQFRPMTPLGYDVSSPEMSRDEDSSRKRSPPQDRTNEQHTSRRNGGISRDKTTPPSRHSRNRRHGSGSDEFRPMTPLGHDVSSPEMSGNEGSSRKRSTQDRTTEQHTSSSKEFYPLTPLNYDVSSPEMSRNDRSPRNSSTPQRKNSQKDEKQRAKDERHRSSSHEFQPLSPLGYDVSSTERSRNERSLRNQNNQDKENSRNNSTTPRKNTQNERHRSSSQEFYPLTPLGYDVSSTERSRNERKLGNHQSSLDKENSIDYRNVLESTRIPNLRKSQSPSGETSMDFKNVAESTRIPNSGQSPSGSSEKYSTDYRNVLESTRIPSLRKSQSPSGEISMDFKNVAESTRIPNSGQSPSDSSEENSTDYRNVLESTRIPSLRKSQSPSGEMSMDFKNVVESTRLPESRKSQSPSGEISMDFKNVAESTRIPNSRQSPSSFSEENSTDYRNVLESTRIPESRKSQSGSSEEILMDFKNVAESTRIPDPRNQPHSPRSRTINAMQRSHSNEFQPTSLDKTRSGTPANRPNFRSSSHSENNRSSKHERQITNQHVSHSGPSDTQQRQRLLRHITRREKKMGAGGVTEYVTRDQPHKRNESYERQHRLSDSIPLDNIRQRLSYSQEDGTNFQEYHQPSHNERNMHPNSPGAGQSHLNQDSSPTRSNRTKTNQNTPTFYLSHFQERRGTDSMSPVFNQNRKFQSSCQTMQGNQNMNHSTSLYSQDHAANQYQDFVRPLKGLAYRQTISDRHPTYSDDYERRLLYTAPMNGSSHHYDVSKLSARSLESRSSTSKNPNPSTLVSEFHSNPDFVRQRSTSSNSNQLSLHHHDQQLGHYQQINNHHFIQGKNTNSWCTSPRSRHRTDRNDTNLYSAYKENKSQNKHNEGALSYTRSSGSSPQSSRSGFSHRSHRMPNLTVPGEFLPLRTELQMRNNPSHISEQDLQNQSQYSAYKENKIYNIYNGRVPSNKRSPSSSPQSSRSGSSFKGYVIAPTLSVPRGFSPVKEKLQIRNNPGHISEQDLQKEKIDRLYHEILK